MAITKEKKKEIVADLEKALGDAKSVVFVNFHGLPVSDASIMRRALRAEKVGYKVAKKTLVKRVLSGQTISGSQPSFDGELALAYSADLIAPARGIYSFQKKLEGKVSILGGIFEGKYMSKEEMVGIASIPSMDVLRGMFVNIINSPIQRLAIALDQIAQKK
jgi:large subunit ribosomal protein L10